MHSGRVSTSTVNGSSVLKVHSIRFYEAGDFVCTGNNHFGFAQAIAPVTVAGEFANEQA